MAHKIVSIEINFPVEVEVKDHHLANLDQILVAIAADYEKENPGRIMWPFGRGAKMLIHPMMIEDDKPIPFDDSIYTIEMAEREAYAGERNYRRKN